MVATFALSDSINPSLILADLNSLGDRTRDGAPPRLRSQPSLSFSGGVPVALGLADVVRSLLAATR